MLKIKDIDQTQAPLLDHLVELRTRLVRCVLALALAFAVCFYFAAEIFAVLVRPLASAFPEGSDPKLVYTQLYEAFFVEIKVALFAAFFVTFPIIANQLWAFVAPGLYAKEKKAHNWLAMIGKVTKNAANSATLISTKNASKSWV